MEGMNLETRVSFQDDQRVRVDEMEIIISELIRMEGAVVKVEQQQHDSISSCTLVEKVTR